MFGDTTPSELPDKWAMSIRQPIGVAGIITPWNFPIAIPCWKMSAALISGNVVVFKPASDTPHCAALLVELMHEAGFPPGTVNLVTGSGEEAGMPIVDNPDVNVVSFTGNGATGRAIAITAARRGKRLSLELGGKNAIAVMADADLDLATTASCGRPLGRPANAAPHAAGWWSTRAWPMPCWRSWSIGRIGCTWGRARGNDRRRPADQPAGGREGRRLRRHRTAGGRPTDRGWLARGRRRPAARQLLRAHDHRRRAATWTASPRRRSSDRCCRSSA